MGFQKSATKLFSVAKLSTQHVSHVHRGHFGLINCNINLERQLDDMKPQVLILAWGERGAEGFSHSRRIGLIPNGRYFDLASCSDLFQKSEVND